MHGPPVLRRMGRNYLVASCTAVVLAVAIVIVREPLGLGGLWWGRLAPLFMGMLPLGVFTPIAWWLTRHVRRDFHAAGGRLCTHCAYNVGAMGDEGTCPECGERFDARADAATWRKGGFTIRAGTQGDKPAEAARGR